MQNEETKQASGAGTRAAAGKAGQSAGLLLREAQPLLDHARRVSCELRIVAGTTDLVHKAVLIGSVEIGFVGSSIADSVVICEQIGQDRLHIVVSPDHPWANGYPVTPADFCSVSWVMREAGSGTRREFSTALSYAAPDMPPRPFFSLRHAERYQSRWVRAFLDSLAEPDDFRPG